MIARRGFLVGGAALATAAAFPSLAAPVAEYGGLRLRDAVAALERRSGGRLGVAVVETERWRRFAWRGDERFPLCSTFKFLLVAAMLGRADLGADSLDRRIRIRPADLRGNSPFAKSRVGRTASLLELCEAAITLSDNAAADLLLPAVGGPAGLTRFVRALGDPMTRLDRGEPAMSEAGRSDPRDTTTPYAMVRDLERILLNDAIRPASVGHLTRWLLESKTGKARLRAGLPRGWQVGDKTGSGDHGTDNDIAIVWPEGPPPRLTARPPLLIAAYLTGSRLDRAGRDSILAGLARAIAAELG
jgi:beta-lactamase class A